MTERPPSRSLASRLPIVGMMRGYERGFLQYDAIAGLVLATMLIPQGMAYAELTGLPAITGIYTTIAALIAYAIFGPNRRLVLGPDSSLAPVIAVIVLPLAAGNTMTAVALASALSIIAGLVCIAAGFLRFGVVTELMSKPIRIGYLNGIAVVVFVSQLPKALGFSVDADTTVSTFVETMGNLGDTIPASVFVSVATVALIIGSRWVSPLVPGVVIAAAFSILVVSWFDLTSSGLQVVGDIPAGLPPLDLPIVEWSVVPALFTGALAVALVSFADTGALSTATALKSGVRVDPNSEIKALGAANLLSGLFQGFPTSGSSSRTAIAMAVGSQTQLTGIIAAAGVILVMLLVPGVVAEMPSPTLAAIVVTASFTLFDWQATKWIFRARTSEFVMLLGAFLGVVLIGILQGIAVAVILSMANFLRKAIRPHSTELGKIADVPGYHDRARHPEAEPVDGMLIVRFDAPLFFANAPTFGRRLQQMLRTAGREIDFVLLVGNAVTDIDTTGAEILGDVLDDLDGRGIAFAFAGLKGPVKDRLRAYGLFDRIGEASFYPNTISAVGQYARRDGVSSADTD